jgi:hypothetical protein
MKRVSKKTDTSACVDHSIRPQKTFHQYFRFVIPSISATYPLENQENEEKCAKRCTL